MPQELRKPEKRTGKHYDEVTRIIELYSALRLSNLPDMVQKMAVEAIWPDMTREEKMMFISCWPELDKMYSENLQNQTAELN